MIEQAFSVTKPAGSGNAMQGLVRDAVFVRTVEGLLALAANPAASSAARATAIAHLGDLRQQADLKLPVYAYVARRIGEFDRDPAKFAPVKATEAPPGMPIGMSAWDRDDEPWR